jgi:hypothetical protein
MGLRLNDIRGELPPLIHLALSVIAGELGLVSMSQAPHCMRDGSPLGSGEWYVPWRLRWNIPDGRSLV